MKIPLEFYNHIRDTVRVSDIVRQRLVLARKGGEYLGICPFHDENDLRNFVKLIENVSLLSDLPWFEITHELDHEVLVGLVLPCVVLVAGYVSMVKVGVSRY